MLSRPNKGAFLPISFSLCFCNSASFSNRTLGERSSLGSFIFLLLRSLILRKNVSVADYNAQNLDDLISNLRKEWEFNFAIQTYEQYSCLIWLSSLVVLLRKIGKSNQGEEYFLELLLAMQFISHKLQDPELSFKLETMTDSDNIQVYSNSVLNLSYSFMYTGVGLLHCNLRGMGLNYGK